MEFEKIVVEPGVFYWTWRDVDFLPYAWLEERDLKKLPLPFYLEDIHPDSPVGFPCEGEESKTNEIILPRSFEGLKLTPDLRKDLRRVEKKNSSTQIVSNEKNALEKAGNWFLELWDEEPAEFKRRMLLWKDAFTLSAYSEEKLLGVHISLPEKNGLHYLGCWWDRSNKNLSIPTFLLKKDVERAISLKLSFYDLGVGSEPYKKQWGVLERQTKYYAAMQKPLAQKLGLKRFVDIS
ncbi:MAG: GNAT family N-acetyltransferase [Candidatus Micrarchaeota archaeon]